MHLIFLKQNFMNLDKGLDKLTNLNNIYYDAEATTATRQNTKNIFCSEWLSTKVVLVLETRHAETLHATSLHASSLKQ